MENRILKNYQEELVKKREKLCSITELYLDNEIIKSELDSVDSLYEKIKTAKPEIMFYGIYNAGKSSVLNELLGSDRAKVDDIPTTCKIDKYEWNGYTIVDTPGVGAPIEHEKVTEEHLQHADVVLFVISDAGSHEYLENYHRLKTIAERGKKIIIVLNDKDGKLGSPEGKEDLQIVKRQVVANAKSMGLSDGNYVIIEVNADDAKTGRREGSSELIEMSNIKILEKLILSELKRMPTFDILRRSILEIEKHLETIIGELGKSETDADIQTLNGFLENLREEKKNARQEIISYINRRSNRMAKELPFAIWEHRNEGQTAVNNIAQKHQEDFLRDVQQQMQVVLQGMFENLNVAASNISVLQIDPPKEILLPPNSQMEFAEVSASRDSWQNKVSHAIDKAQKLLEESEKYKTYTAPSKAAGALALPVVGQLAKTLGKSSILPSIPVSVITPIVIGIVKALFSDEDEKKRESAIVENENRRRIAEAEAQARQELQQRCLYAAEDIADKIRLNMDLMLNQIVEDIRHPFREQMETGKDEKKKRVESLTALRYLYEEYESIRYELGSLK